MLPQMNDKFAAFIEPAREKAGTLRFLGGILCLTLLYGALSFLALLICAGVISFASKTDFSIIWLSVRLELSSPNHPQIMIVLLTTFVGVFCAVWITVLVFRRQGLRVLFGPGNVAGNAIRTCVILSPALLFMVILSRTLGHSTPNLPLSEWLLWMIPALPLLFVQICSEELIFRGYLLQEFAVRFRARWIWMVVPSLMFGALHYQPALLGSNAVLVVVGTTIFGIIAADLTVRTGNLGAAIGLHFMNNLMAMMLISLDGTLNGLSLYVTNTHASDLLPVRGLLLLDIATISALYLVYMYVMNRREHR